MKTTQDIITERLIAALQQVQKENPFGSKLHREAHDKIREIVKCWKGTDIGDYE